MREPHKIAGRTAAPRGGLDPSSGTDDLAKGRGAVGDAMERLGPLHQPSRNEIALGLTCARRLALPATVVGARRADGARSGGDRDRPSTEIKLRAEMRAGELLKQMADRDERPRGRQKESHVATLSDLGVTKIQSSRWQLAALQREAEIAKAKKKGEGALYKAKGHDALHQSGGDARARQQPSRLGVPIRVASVRRRQCINRVDFQISSAGGVPRWVFDRYFSVKSGAF